MVRRCCVFLPSPHAPSLTVKSTPTPKKPNKKKENISDPTETYEFGSPTSAREIRNARSVAARNQLNSNFAPVKRLTLERKSPVTRLDLNAPYFNGYRRTYPGLFDPSGEGEKGRVEEVKEEKKEEEGKKE